MSKVNEIDFIKVSAMKITPVTRRKTIGLAVAYLASPEAVGIVDNIKMPVYRRQIIHKAVKIGGFFVG
jgi:hypothetical protein